MDLETGECRVIVSEHQDTWQTNSPRMRYLADKRRFIWPSDKTGFTQYEVRDLDGDLHNAVTSGDFQTGGIQFVDEDANLVGFTGYSSDANPYFLQYHMVGLDGENQRRVTSRDFHHSNFNLSPDKKWLIAQYEETNTPPNTVVYNTADGSVVAKLAETDPNTAANLAEMFKFVSNDGRFDIYGVLFFPADFDPGKSYPVLNPLYAGPGGTETNANYVSSPRAETDRGYLVVRVNNRGGGNRGKEFLGSTYERLGDVEIQDHADAIRFLRQRAYFDGDRVGIVGSSYGGYMAAMGIFKHPDVYAASVNKSGVTDWRNYDTIYTERYMSTPQLNPEGYKNGSVMTYVDQFEGQILIMHGMIDDNVHPNNAFQLIDAMDKADKRYESRFFPNRGHGVGAGGTVSQWEFFDRVLKPNVDGR
jgi:dipeptidyl-peptidase-4